MKKILDLHKPFIKFSPCYGAVFSIIDISDNNLAWLFNNFSYLHVIEDHTNKSDKKVYGSLTALSYYMYGNVSYHNY